MAKNPIRDVQVLIDGERHEGILRLPPQARSLVLFAHGSGSSRLSGRNNYVAEVLAESSIASLMFDLLSEREDQSRANLEATRRNVTQATRSAYLGLVAGAGQVKALEAAEASSQSALDANRLGYQVGVRINIDVLNAQGQLYQTKRDLAVARYNLLMGQLRLRQANGTLTAEDLRPVNAALAAPGTTPPAR